MSGVQAIEGKGKLRISTAGKNENVIETTEIMGLGIAKEYLSVIHNPFFTTKEQVTDTYLELDIVGQLVVKDSGKN